MDNDIDWEEVEQIIGKIISDKMKMAEGIKYLDEQLSHKTGIYLLNKIDVNRFETEFQDWIAKVLSEEKIPSHIKSLYFETFTMCDPRYNEGRDTITVCFTGSASTPEEDIDWACWDDNTFLPESKYMVLTDLCLIDELLKKEDFDGDFEFLLYNGVLSLLIINHLDKYKESLLLNHSISSKKPHENFLYVGIGFDSVDTIVGKITSNGFL